VLFRLLAFPRVHHNNSTVLLCLLAGVALPIMRAKDLTFVGAIVNGCGRAKAATTARTIAKGGAHCL
jgi:hypothetical protein